MQSWQWSGGGTPALMGRKGMKKGGRKRKLGASDSCPFPEPSLNLHPPSITRDFNSLHFIFCLSSLFPPTRQDWNWSSTTFPWEVLFLVMDNSFWAAVNPLAQNPRTNHSVLRKRNIIWRLLSGWFLGTTSFLFCVDNCWTAPELPALEHPFLPLRIHLD